MTGRVIVVGSVNVDLVVRGKRLPGPGETVTGGTFERHHGGKGGNQAVASARLGAETFFIGAVGDDALGSDARAALTAERIDDRGLVTIPGASTGVALILVDPSGENLISVAPGANARLSAGWVSDQLDRIDLRSGDVVLASREIPADAVRAALRAGRSVDARTVLNPAPADDFDIADLPLVDVLTPNLSELTMLAGGTVEVGDGRIPAWGIREAMVVTKGKDGATILPADGSPAIDFDAVRVDAVDSTGAGDTFAGALAAGLAHGLRLADAVRRAIIAAGLATRLAGAREGMPTAAQVDEVSV